MHLKHLLNSTLLTCLLLATTTKAEVWTYAIPGGEEYSSPDYEVTLISGKQKQKSFVHYSFAKNEYPVYDWKLQQKELRRFKDRPTVASSTALFSFSDKVTVRVKVRASAKQISLPLKSAKVLPSSYNIPCKIENGDTIVFTLDRPEKVVVIANYDQAWEVFEKRAKGHVPIVSRDCDYEKELKRSSYKGKDLPSAVSEGYQTPLFIVAQPPEKKIPEKDSPKTLVIKPGQTPTQKQLDRYDVLWFEPGIHDLSGFGSIPWHQTLLKGGQTVYLAGGSYVKARFKKNPILGKGDVTILGRGFISGIKHKWALSFPEGSQTINIDRMEGIAITDRACFGTYGGKVLRDVALLGAWHGNNDGPDHNDDCLIENCLLVAHDDNLKLNSGTHARHIVIWQDRNAHPIMVKEMRDDVVFKDTIVEDVDVITYWKAPSTWWHPWGKMGPGAISFLPGNNTTVQNFVFRNIRIESPYLFRVINFYILDNKQPYTPSWLATFPAGKHGKINGILLENITVNSPVIAYRSQIGSAFDNSLQNIRFVNLKINGEFVTNANKEKFFDIEENRVKNLKFEVLGK